MEVQDQLAELHLDAKEISFKYKFVQRRFLKRRFLVF